MPSYIESFIGSGLSAIITKSSVAPLERIKILKRPEASQDTSIKLGANKIIDEVRLNGDRALFELTNKLDGVSLQTLRVSDDEIKNSKKQLPSEAFDAINLAINNVKNFHEQQIPKAIAMLTARYGKDWAYDIIKV